MAAAYANKSTKRQETGGRIGAQSQMSGGSQPNLAGTVNRTQVERRPAQFISARSRLESDSHVLDGRSSPKPGTSTLKRLSKSQDRLNSSSSSLGSGSSRSNLHLAQSKADPRVDNNARVGSESRINVVPQSLHGNNQNYNSLSSYSNNIKNMERDNRNSTSSSIISQGSSASNNRSFSTSAVDNKFHEFEKVRLDYLRRGKLYEDTIFLPNATSIYFSRNSPYEFEWIRAKDFAQMLRLPPMFFNKGFDRFDVQQGQLGDCWLLAAMACLSNPDHLRLFERVVPAGQNFQDGWYAGVFSFHFWHYGQWKQVFVDDFLPTYRSQLAFVHSSDPNEFWAALMEKAYAKLYGSYEALKGGHLMDSLTDLTGGLTEHYNVKGPNANLPNNIINILFKSLERMSLIGCSIDGSSETVLRNGLVQAHAYSVTDLRRIFSGQQPVHLIRIRNPHGDSKEWRGRWSEWSTEWQQIPPSDRTRLGLIQRDDGEFWMDFEDFIMNFDNLDICHLTPDAPLDIPRKWQVVEHHGRWIKGFNAGGRPSREDSHWANPQYHLRLEDTDEDEDNVCSIIVQLMQKDRRKMKQKGEIFLFIGFSIYQYEKGYSLPLKKDFFDFHQAVEHSGAYINVRQVTKRLALSPGEYVLVPSTYEVDEIGDYYIRFYFEKGNVVEFCDDKPEKTEIIASAVPPEVKEQEETFKKFFYKVSGEDMEVNAFELRTAINEGLKNESLHQDISIEACRSFVSLMDVDGNGHLGFLEFQFLWNHLRSWKKIYYQFDKDHSGRMDGKELRTAINGAGYKVSNKTLASLTFKFADEKGMITLDSFLTLMARLMKTFNTFHETQKDGTAVINIEQWLEKTLQL